MPYPWLPILEPIYYYMILRAPFQRPEFCSILHTLRIRTRYTRLRFEMDGMLSATGNAAHTESTSCSSSLINPSSSGRLFRIGPSGPSVIRTLVIFILQKTFPRLLRVRRSNSRRYRSSPTQASMPPPPGVLCASIDKTVPEGPMKFPLTTDISVEKEITFPCESAKTTSLHS
jgi:hypothetical protein